MRYGSSLLVVVVASVVALACGGDPADESLDSSTAAAANAKVTPWTFAKIPATWSRHAVTAPVSGLDALPFAMTVSGVRSGAVTRMSFMVTGTAQLGELSNVQLVYFPNGVSRPGVVVATNPGSSWAPGPFTSTLNLVLSTPIAWQNGGKFRAEFALRVDVNGTRTFFFDTQLQTVTVIENGVEQALLAGTCDLPLHGDSFYVN